MIFRTVLLLIISFLGFTSASPKVNAAKQVLNIVNNPDLYDAAILPKEEGAIRIEVNMFIRDLEIDDINMQIILDLTFRMMWRDHRLKYSEPGVRSVRFTDYKKFWIPDPFFPLAVKTIQTETIHPDAFISVNNRGNITFSTRFRIVSKCPMDLRRFPHDRQVCKFKIASYGFGTDDLVFLFQTHNPIQLPKYLSIYNYILEKLNTDYCYSITNTGNYSCLSVNLNLNRIFPSYLCDWYIPCISLVIIAFFSELLAVDAILPRLVLTIGPLLVLMTSSIFYSSKLPSVPYTTALDLFTGISLTTIFVICLHVIIGFYYANKKEQPKPETSDEESATKFQKLKSKLVEKGDYWTRIVIIGFYSSFLFLYFLAYSV